jgi:hypothetical protein
MSLQVCASSFDGKKCPRRLARGFLTIRNLLADMQEAFLSSKMDLQQCRSILNDKKITCSVALVFSGAKNVFTAPEA